MKLSPYLYFPIFLVGILLLNEGAFAVLEEFPKNYRRFVVRFGGPKEGDMTTKVLPEDKAFIEDLRRICQGRKFDKTTEAKAMKILKQTDAGLVVESALRLLRFFPKLTSEVINDLNSLSFCKDGGIGRELARTFSKFSSPESVIGMITLLGDEDSTVRMEARHGLCYFGIEAIATLPFISPEEFSGNSALLLSKVVYHLCNISFIAGGVQFLPSPESAYILMEYPPPPPFYYTIIHLPQHSSYANPPF